MHIDIYSTEKKLVLQ